ncbi:MAG TPA: hypothetical protein VFQ45_08680 [Longimicrobium sp.]|nr:hypothetical protein [Longimicrobium sp.]
MVDRAPRPDDPYLEWKVRLFFAGAALLFGGILFDFPLAAVFAIAVLAAGMILVLMGRIQRGADSRADDE